MAAPRTRTVTQKTESYRAVDAHGREHVVDVFTDFVEVVFLDNTTSRAEGRKSHKLSSGEHLNINADGTLEVARTGETLRRVE